MVETTTRASAWDCRRTARNTATAVVKIRSTMLLPSAVRSRTAPFEPRRPDGIRGVAGVAQRPDDALVDIARVTLSDLRCHRDEDPHPAHREQRAHQQHRIAVGQAAEHPPQRGGQALRGPPHQVSQHR